MVELGLGLRSGTCHPFPLRRISPEVILSPSSLSVKQYNNQSKVASWFSFSYHHSRELSYFETRKASCGDRQISRFPCIQCSSDDKSIQIVNKPGKKEHHLWKKRDSAGSGQKALHLVRIVSNLPNEKEAIYGALDKWTAWETEFPVIAAAKALKILRQRKQWLRIIQVSKWLLSKGQVLTMGTYDTLLLAFDMDARLDEAETIWNMILQTLSRSVSKRLFSRMISLYEHHHMPDKILEVFTDMEELGVRPDDDTVGRVSRAFEILGQIDKTKMLMKKYRKRWRYLHFNGERVRVPTD